MSVQSRLASSIEVGPIGTGPPLALDAPIARLERCIGSAQHQIEEQEAHLRQASLTGHASALEMFELQKMRLLLAILQEGRARLLELA